MKVLATLGTLALIAVGIPAGVSFADTPRHESGGNGAEQASTQADSFLAGRPRVPASLVPPPGNVLHSVFKARGVQVYRCAAGKWELLEPAATLTGVRLDPAKRVTALHFRGPSWQSDQDGSVVVGGNRVSEPSHRPGAIPQLLVTADSARGGGIFGRVTFIQRLDPVGGAAPAGGCAGDEITSVPYRAVYRFFVAER